MGALTLVRAPIELTIRSFDLFARLRGGEPRQCGSNPFGKRGFGRGIFYRTRYSLDCWELFREFSVLVGLHRQDLSEFVDLVAEVLILGLELSDQGILHGNSMGVLSRSLSMVDYLSSG